MAIVLTRLRTGLARVPVGTAYHAVRCGHVNGLPEFRPGHGGVFPDGITAGSCLVFPAIFTSSFSFRKEHMPAAGQYQETRNCRYVLLSFPN